MATKTRELKDLINGKFTARAQEVRQKRAAIRKAAWEISKAYQEGVRLLAAVKAYNERKLGQIVWNYREKFELEMGDAFEVKTDETRALDAKLQKIAALAEDAELILALAKAPTLDADVRALLKKLSEI